MPPTHTRLLTVNGGSSSIKFTVFEIGDPPRRMLNGAITAIGTADALLRVDGIPDDQRLGADGRTHGGAARVLLAWLDGHPAGRDLSAVVHRLVHGGDRFVRTQRLTPAVLQGLREIASLAPNHLPDEIALVEAFATARPDATQVACFDTAFHHDLPAVSRTLPVPSMPGLRRYGFHGLSYAYLVADLTRHEPALAHGRLVLAHLGHGASLAAVRDRRPVDTTMGLTPAGGLVMGTRTGDLDPGVVTYLARERRLDTDALEHLLTDESGLRAIGGDDDMRVLLAHEASDPRARLAVEVFCYQARKMVAGLAAALEGLDGLVFTGGIGEHAPVIRQRICAGLAFLGVRLDAPANASGARVISAATSAVAVRVIPTDEAAMMARDAASLLTAGF
jgi:acetate kinase